MRETALHRCLRDFRLQFISTLLWAITVPLMAQVSDQGISVTEVEEEIGWDLTPIQTTTFVNGEKLSVVEEDWQWINYCSKRKPSVWIKDENGRKAYYYNYYAVSDPRGLVPDKSNLPSVEQIRNNEIPGFPQKTFTNGYLEQDTENELVPTVPTPGDQYYWTTSKHESAAQGEEVAYIFKYSDKTGVLGASTGQFCDGYAAIAYSQHTSKNNRYRSLLPNEFKNLNQEFIDYLLLEPGYYDNVKYLFSTSLRFDNQGFNKSPKFSLSVSNDATNKKDRITTVYSLDETLGNYFKYPKYKGRPLECSDTINISIHTVWSGLETKVKNENLPSEMLPENFRSNFLKAAQMGYIRQVDRAFIMDANGDLGAYKQKIIKSFGMRGPMCVLLSPIGFGLKTVTGTYSKGYKRGAKTMGVLLALLTPFSIAAAVNGYEKFTTQSDAFILDPLPPGVKEEVRVAREMALVGAGVYCFSFTTNFIGSLVLGSKNKKMQKRINTYMDERYPYGIVIGYERK